MLRRIHTNQSNDEIEKIENNNDRYKLQGL